MDITQADFYLSPWDVKKICGRRAEEENHSR
jgi:hypothetical protein